MNSCVRRARSPAGPLPPRAVSPASAARHDCPPRPASVAGACARPAALSPGSCSPHLSGENLLCRRGRVLLSCSRSSLAPATARVAYTPFCVPPPPLFSQDEPPTARGRTRRRGRARGTDREAAVAAPVARGRSLPPRTWRRLAGAGTGETPPPPRRLRTQRVAPRPPSNATEGGASPSAGRRARGAAQHHPPAVGTARAKVERIASNEWNLLLLVQFLTGEC